MDELWSFCNLNHSGAEEADILRLYVTADASHQTAIACLIATVLEGALREYAFQR